MFQRSAGAPSPNHRTDAIDGDTGSKQCIETQNAALKLRERGFHRIELEIYGFNERAQRHAERAGFVREGVKRQAYRRGDGWVDGVLYAVVAEDLDEPR